MEKKETYYRETIPKLIAKHKLMIDECLKIMGQKISTDLSDDKKVNVIRSKRMSAETVEWSSKEIDRLQLELLQDPSEENKVLTKNYSEHLAS